MPRSLEMREGQKYSQIFQRKTNSNLGISEYMFVHVIYPRNTLDFSLDEPERLYNICRLTSMNIAKNTLNHVIYPRNTQAYNDDWTSTWMNQKGYITFAYNRL